MSKKYTYEFVKEYIGSFGYKLLSGKYINSRTKLLIKCPKGHEYEISFNGFKQGYRCSYCCGNAKPLLKDIEEYMKTFNYTLLSDKYKNSASKLSLVCPLGHKFEMSWDSFKNKNQRCPICVRRANADKHRLSYDEVKEYIESFGYELLSEEYIDNQTKLLVRCPYGHEYEVRYANFYQGSRCPICNISKGERKIISCLEENNIEYIYEKTFKNLLGVNGGNLSYDFYLPKYNLLIEYQGEYHDGSVLNETKERFEKQQEHDRRKREYAKDNGYNLLEIWYWDFDNIENILIKELIINN